MDRKHLIVELALAGGQAKRFHIKYRAIAMFFGAVALMILIAAGAFSSYMSMFLQVAHYKELRANFDQLRDRYQHLQQLSKQHNQQMASLESLATEVSAAYGIHEPGQELAAPMDDDFAGKNVKESIEEYNFLKSANFSHIYHHYAAKWQTNIQPNMWPLVGTIRSSFGGRSDPFSGEGAFHTGIDLQAPIGTQVHATADGTIQAAGFSGRYGKLVVVDHGNGVETFYAHLSQLLVVPGQEVRRNEVIGLSGATGHVTGPHLHYEVRIANTPVNPYKYMGKAENSQAVIQAQVVHAATGHNDLGL